ncbi:hypothetical protein [Carboxydothermus pertinax]|uniref:Uncharacterized protein n=1 Tax=Carboxydothermus pertinax TaxID=870242 RepID=A0A1L8CRU3_9THEO|nr:hypothetical protein [Carboxydothermus pertinax]GAV21623.1 hypothetical protein cpu_01330 [Carboxydothermus pertinax]
MTLTQEQIAQINEAKATIEVLRAKQELIKKQTQADIDALYAQIQARIAQRDNDVNAIEQQILTYQSIIDQYAGQV